MKIVIEYDTEKKRAAIMIDDRPAQVWKDCEFNLAKSVELTEIEGWIRQEPTAERSLTLYGTRTA